MSTRRGGNDSCMITPDLVDDRPSYQNLFRAKQASGGQRTQLSQISEQRGNKRNPDPACFHASHRSKSGASSQGAHGLSKDFRRKLQDYLEEAADEVEYDREKKERRENKRRQKKQQ